MIGESGRVSLWEREGMDGGREGGSRPGMAADLHTLNPVSDTGEGRRQV